MKILSVILFYLSTLNSYSQDRIHSNLSSNNGLRENEDLLIEISDLEISYCPHCHIPGTRYSYKIKVKDAFLKIDVAMTAKGPIYTPYLDSYNHDERGFDGHNLPREGLYIGRLYQKCAPWGVLASGGCKDYQIKYSLTGKIIDY